MANSPLIPYILFGLTFFASLSLLAGFEYILESSSSYLIACLFVALTISLIVFIVSAIVYSIDNRGCNYHQKIRELY